MNKIIRRSTAISPQRNLLLTLASVSLLILLLGFSSACNLPGESGGYHTPAQSTVSKSIDPTLAAPLLFNLTADTAYRTGPGELYDLVGVLPSGTQVQAVGRSPDGAFLLIYSPVNPAFLVWIPVGPAPLNDGFNNLPVATPIATPTPVPGGGGGGSGCPSPVGGGPTPVDCSGGGIPGSGCPSPVGGGPTPVNCSGGGGNPGSGCPSPVGGGPTPVDCSGGGGGNPGSGCPSPVGGGPTPVDCSGGGGGGSTSGCPSPVSGGPTPLSCPTSVP